MFERSGTVLQQHMNGLTPEAPPTTPAPSSAAGSRPDTRATQRRTASTSPVPMNRLHPVPTYSYLGESPSLRRPIDPYDRKVSSPAMHYHLPYPSTVGAVDTQRIRGRKSAGAGSTYLQQLRDRRSRSHSRSGMRMLVERMKSSSPRPRSPRMYNEEAIAQAQYPDGEIHDGGVERPIERDDFPAPPFAYGGSRRRHHSEPGSSMRSGGSYESTPVISSDEEGEDEVDTVDGKLQRTEEVLQKMAAQGMMAKVFLQDIEVEKQKRKAAKHKRLDPRSAARTPAAKKEPHFRLRYDNPVNASPSRVADHVKPWDDDILLESSLSRPRSAVTPFLPAQTPVQHRERAISPGPVRPGYEGRAARTLPPRFSPGCLDVSDAGVGAYSTEFSSNRSEDGLGFGSSLGHRSPTMMQQNIRVSSTYTQGLQAATPRSGSGGGGGGYETSGTDDLDHSIPDILQAANIYPLHLLFTTNYRLPGDVDRCNLEKHLSDADFDMVFRLSREDFYRLPYWKRCDLKRKYHLF